MLSEADPNSLVEPWFALSKDRYRSILNQALSEMEPREPEALVQAELLPNCTELIKLLNQDDGLSNETDATALLAPPDAKRSAAFGARPAPYRPGDGKGSRFGTQQVRSLGSQLFSGGAKRKRTTSCKGNSFGSLCKSLRKGSEGTQMRGCVNGKISETSVESSAATTLLRRTESIGRGKDSVQDHDESLRRRRNFESKDPTSAAQKTNCEYSLRFPEAFSLRFHDNGRRPSDVRYFQGHHLPAGGSVVAIPNRDLSRSKIVPIVKEEEERWSCSNSFPCALAATVQGVKIEPKDEFSTISGKKKTLEQSILRPPSCTVDRRNNIPPTTTTPTGRSDRNDSSAEVTSRQPPTSDVGVDFAVGVTPFVELLKSDQSVVSCFTSRRTDHETGDSTTAPPIRVVPARIRATVENHFKHSPSASYSSHLNGRNLAVSGTRYSNDDAERREVCLVTQPGGENTLLRDEERGASSPSDLLRVTFDPHRPRRGAPRCSKRGSPSFRRESELWAAIDKSMVNSMMQQILDEENAIKHRLKHTHLNENEEGEEEEEEDHLCPNGLVEEVDPVKRTKFPPGDISSVFIREANTRIPDHSITFVESNMDDVGANGISKLFPVSSQESVRDLRIKSKSSSANKNSDIAGSSSSSSRSGCSSASQSDDRYIMPDMTATRTPALISETGTGDRFQNCDTIAFNAQKLGMSRMSFKWKSKMLNRLRKDQIRANKWCISETLSA